MPVVLGGRGAAVGAVLAVLLVPQVANATTVSVVGGQLRVQGQPAEANRLTITASGTTYTVTDAGASVTPGAGCSGTPVTCTAVTNGFVVTAGDAGDEVQVTATAAGTIDGGAGDDELQGGSGNEEISGGAGFDELRGGAGDDSFDGGVDRDIVSYADHAGSVRVTLDDVANDGAPGERDDVKSSVEDVFGGPGADLIKGSGLPNRLRGGDGADSLDGAGGSDSLEGGDGNDLLNSGDSGVVDDVLCGAGVDSAYADAADTVAADCEAVQRTTPPPGPPPPGGGEDTTAPRLTAFDLSRAAFSAAPRGSSARPAARRRARVGTKVRFRLSENATVRFGVVRRKAGRNVRGSCRRLTRRNRTRRKCGLRLKGGFSRPGKQGENSFAFTGRLRGRKLKPGRYYLVARATDGAGNQATAKRVKFKILKMRPPVRTRVAVAAYHLDP
jgi:Ca2+-binding RTX toxin-like protein